MISTLLQFRFPLSHNEKLASQQIIVTSIYYGQLISAFVINLQLTQYGAYERHIRQQLRQYGNITDISVMPVLSQQTYLSN